MMEDRRPTWDQLSLAAKLNGDCIGTYYADGPHRITPAAVQRWNIQHGVVRVTEALRSAWGTMQPARPENPYAYVRAILRGAA